MRAFVIILLAVGVALAYFNPTMEAFEDFAADRVEEVVMQEAGDGTLGRLLAGVGAGLAGTYLDRVTERANYVVFSTYTIDLDQNDPDNEAWRFLGIAGQFVELERPESLQEDAGQRGGR